MKIVAIIKNCNFNGKYLVEVETKELEKITGGENINRELRVGDDFQVSNIFDKYKSMTNNKRRLKDIRDLAENIIESTEKIKPIVAPHVEK